MMDVIVINSSKAGEWNTFVERNLHASVYHLWEWGEVLSSTYKYRRHYIATTKNDELIGIIPLIHVNSKLFGSRLVSLPFCEYGGMLTDNELDGQETRQAMNTLLGATHTIARNLGAEYVEIRSSEVSVAQDSLHVLGYNNLQRYLTFKVDLAKEPRELWRNLRKSTRNAVRKAMKNHVDVEKVTSIDQLKAYFKLYLETQKRHGSPPHSFKLFKKLHDVFHKDKLSILLASYQREPIGGIMVFFHNKTIFWWNNVTDTKHRNLNPTNLLLWNTAEWGLKKGYRFLDLGRTREGTTMYFFKNGWGGQEIGLQDNIYFLGSKRRGLPDPTQRGYEYLSKIWTFMPIGLAEKIGPRIISGIAL